LYLYLAGEKSLTKPITLIMGGARSGKSSYAEKIAASLGGSVLYIATAKAGDAEMAERIAAHRVSRPADWQTLETPRNVDQALDNLQTAPQVMLLDCLTLLVTNIVLSMEEAPQHEIEAVVLAEVEAIVNAQRRLDAPMLVVSNEVGLGLVPPYPLGRVYRDALGRANQNLAAQADNVLFMVAGLPMIVKGELPQ
jgi:adenosylcobinamide kinase/adenosylcobinamide-phosphate guanylyltransferase